MSNLTKRILSALIGVPLIFLCTYLGGTAFFILIIVLILLSSLEMGKLIESKGIEVNRVLIVVFSLALGVAAWRGYSLTSATLTAIVVLACIFEIFTGAVKNALTRLSYLMFAVLYIGWLESHFLLLRNPANGDHIGGLTLGGKLSDPGFFFIVFVVTATFVNDTFAYFVGKRIGKTKLMASVSPRKTLEGTIGGIIGTAASGIVVNLLFKSPLSIEIAVIWAVLISVLAVFGDLVESLIKRDAEIKDTGAIIPGHGGVLDRFDSLLFTVPASYYFLVLLARADGLLHF